MNEEFGNKSQTLSTFVVSIYALGFSFGPLIAGPLSEIYGRRPVLIVGNIILTACQLGCALSPNLGSVITFRFLGGIGGCASMSLASGVMADLFAIQQRGFANGISMLAQALGAGFAPVLGGFIAQQLAWRWAYWILLIGCGALTVMHWILGEESNAAVLMRRKTAQQRKAIGNMELRSAYDKDIDPALLTTKAVLMTGIARPFRIMYSSPVLQLTALHQCIIFGTFFLLVSTMADLFMNTYEWDVQTSGLAYLGIPIGFIIGSLIVVRTSDALVIHLTHRNNGVFEPEFRLPPAIFYGLLAPIGLFWYGWSAEKHKHWIQPALAIVPFAVGDSGVFNSVQTYFIDATGQYAASASATFLAARCLFAVLLPLAAPTMYARLGLGWGNSILGFISIAMIPIPFFIYRYGARLRKKFPIRVDGRAPSTNGPRVSV